MKKQVQALLLIPATLLLASQPILAQEDLDSYNGTALMHSLQAAHSTNKPRQIVSDHTVSITNTDLTGKSYHIEFKNYVFMNGAYSNAATKKMDVNLNSGETSNLSDTISGNVYFYTADKYPLRATTAVYLNGKKVLYQENNNYAYIS